MGAFGGSSGGGGGGKRKGKTPNFTPVKFQEVGQVSYDPVQSSADLLANYPNLAAFANQATANRTAQREAIMPGSGKQFSQASSALSAFLSGQVPTDVVDFTNRTVAERTGGGFNPFTGGGQSQQAFARSIGRLSTDFTQFGLSAAPAWQQLADSFVTKVEDTVPLALGFGGQRYQYDALNTNIAQFNSEGRLKADIFNSEGGYTAGTNDLLFQENRANQELALANQRQAQGTSNAAMWLNAGTAGANVGLDIAKSLPSSTGANPSFTPKTKAPAKVRTKYGW